MMRVWMVFVQGDDATWLEAAWDDESTAENPSGWQKEVDRVRKLAFDHNYEYRVLDVTVPGVFEAFEISKVSAAGPDPSTSGPPQHAEPLTAEPS